MTFHAALSSSSPVKIQWNLQSIVRRNKDPVMLQYATNGYGNEGGLQDTLKIHMDECLIRSNLHNIEILEDAMKNDPIIFDQHDQKAHSETTVLEAAKVNTSLEA